MKAVHFGAGNIGRGFIGYLLGNSGYEVCFVDIADTIIDAINEYGQYTVTILNEEGTKEEVTNVRGINLKDREAVVKELLDADLITTSIGVNNLPRLAETLKETFEKRQELGAGPLDIIACENAIKATGILEKSVLEVADENLHNYMKEKVGFPNCAVDRIVPNVPIEKERVIDVFAEEFFEWSIETGDIKVNDKIEGAHYVDKLDPYLERKLFLLNGAHATVAYLSYLQDIQYIHEGIQNPEIRKVAESFHASAVEALSKKHGLDFHELTAYANKIIKRFENHYLQDDVKRVGADPVRKLSFADRLISPLSLCAELGVSYDAIATGIAAGYRFNAKGDAKAAQVQVYIQIEGVKKAIEKFSNLPVDSEMNKAITDKYSEQIQQAYSKYIS